MSIRRPKSRRLLCLLALLLAPPLFVVAWLSFEPDKPSAHPDFDRVRRGMTLNQVRSVLDRSAELRCLKPGPGTEQYLVVWEGDRAGGMIYLRAGAVQGKEYLGRDMSFRDRFRQWWIRNVGISLPF